MRCVYLNFHGIGEPQRPLEPGEAPYWLSQGAFEDILGLVEELKGQVETRITFDDGNASDLAIGAKALAQQGVKATFFVLSDRIDTPGSLSKEDIGRLLEQGHRIGVHGAAHCDWTTLDETGRNVEMDQARARIQDITGSMITCAALPFGRYNRTVLKALTQRGYREIYSSDGGRYSGKGTPIPRTSPRADMGLSDIRDLLLGCEGLYRPFRRNLARTVKRLI